MIRSKLRTIYKLRFFISNHKIPFLKKISKIISQKYSIQDKESCFVVLDSDNLIEEAVRRIEISYFKQLDFNTS